jgi:hypothetical protein
MLILCMIILALRRNVLNTLTAAQRHWVYAIPPLSSKPRASRMVFKGIMCFTLIFFFVSCKSVEAVTSDTHHSSLIAHSSHHDTVVLRDSIFVREVQRGDTVYLTRVEWRDRWRTRVERDTVVDVRVEKEVVQLPPERYVPKFYRWCTGILLTILVVAIGRLIRKLFLS